MTSDIRTGLAGSAARGVAWALAASIAGRAISAGALIVLARLLTPEDFGLVAIALISITYLETIGDLGVGAALVYWPRRQDDAAQMAFVINLAAGAAWGISMFLAAPWLAGFFERPDSVWILRVMALTFPVRALGNAHDMLLQKELRFRERMVPEVGMGAAKAAIAIAFALYGWGAWSLVFGHLAGTVAWTLVLWRIEPWRPGMRLPTDLLAPMLRYGRGLVAVNILAAVVHHADLVVVGRMLGTVSLGFYQVAQKVPEMTITVLIWVAGRVLFPAFARIHAEGGDIGSAYLASIRYVTLLTIPAAIGLLLLAEPIMNVVFGPKWTPAAPILQGLAVYLGIRSVGSQAGDVLKGTGRTGLLAGLAAVKAVLVVPVLLIAGGIDASTVAWAMAGTAVATTGLNLGAVRWLDGPPVGAALRAAGPAVAATSVMTASVLGWTRWVLAPTDVGGLVVAIGIGIVAYAAAAYVLFPDLLRRAVRIVRPDATALAEETPP